MARYWYFYTAAASGPFDPVNYTRLNLNPNNCPVGSTVCAIYAPPSDVNPQKPLAGALGDGTRLHSYIVAGSTGSTDYLPVTGVHYVYFKAP